MFIINVLDGCPFCEDSLNTLKKYNLTYKKIVVPYNEKNEYKNVLGTDTFPFLIFETKTKKYIIGGNDNFQNLIKRSLKRIQ